MKTFSRRIKQFPVQSWGNNRKETAYGVGSCVSEIGKRSETRLGKSSHWKSVK